MTFLHVCKPYSNFNNELCLSKEQQHIFGKHYNLFAGNAYVDPKIQGDTNDIGTRFYAEFLHKSYVYVITETVCEYPYPYFSEKTWRAFNTGVPFMMINAQYSLAKLRDFGFKTFNCWWDESYDVLANGADRIQAIVEQLKSLSELSIEDLVNLRQEMLPTLEYNQRHLAVFAKNDLENIAKSI